MLVLAHVQNVQVTVQPAIHALSAAPVIICIKEPVYLPAQLVTIRMLLPAFVQDVQVIVLPALAQACALSAAPVITCIKAPVFLPAQMVIIRMLVPALVQFVQGIA